MTSEPYPLKYIYWLATAEAELRSAEAPVPPYYHQSGWVGVHQQAGAGASQSIGVSPMGAPGGASGAGMTRCVSAGGGPVGGGGWGAPRGGAGGPANPSGSRRWERPGERRGRA